MCRFLISPQDVVEGRTYILHIYFIYTYKHPLFWCFGFCIILIPATIMNKAEIRQFILFFKQWVFGLTMLNVQSWEPAPGNGLLVNRVLTEPGQGPHMPSGPTPSLSPFHPCCCWMPDPPYKAIFPPQTLYFPEWGGDGWGQAEELSIAFQQRNDKFQIKRTEPGPIANIQ